MKRLSLIFLFAAWFVTGCQKEVSFDDPVNNGNGGNNGNYQPLSKNSYWKYRQTGDWTGDFTITATDQKSNKAGIDFTKFTSTNSLASTAQFFGIKEHKYYTWLTGTVPSSGTGGGGSLDVVMYYLNDTASVGFEWDHVAGLANGLVTKTPGIIVGKGLTVTVEGKTYTDVIHTYVELQYEVPVLGTITALGYDYFIAKNIGIIKIETNGDPVLTNGFHVVQSLFEHSIK